MTRLSGRHTPCATHGMRDQRFASSCFVLLVTLLTLVVVAGEARAQQGVAPPAPAAFDASSAAGQEQEAAAEQEPGEQEEDFKRHKVLFLYATGWVRQGDPSPEREGVLVVPTLGIDYEFWINHKFAISVQNDFELSSYVIETHDGEEVDREFAYLVAATFVYEPIANLSLFLGPGYEFEASNSFFVFRVGGAYGIPIRNHWDVGFTVTYDHKDVYDAVSFGVLFGKRF